MRDMRLTCKLTTPALQKRRATVIHELKRMLLKKEPKAEGLRLTFPSTDEVLDKLVDFIKSERLCCAFLAFQLTVGDDTAVLEMDGPEGTSEFLEKELGF